MGFRNLLVRVGLAAANVAAKFDPSGIASQILDSYEKHHDKEQLRAELEEMMCAGLGRFREELADAMGDLRPQVAESARVQVEAYLSAFQTSAKQAARVFGDPSATTVPATVAVNQPEQLAAFLPQRPPRFRVGDCVPGLPSWKLVEPLGAGGFGEVWRAENPYSSTAAFKFFLDPAARKRFTRAEAENIARILREAPTDGVVKLLAAEPEQDPPWLQFEYIAGGDLSSLLEQWKRLPDGDRVNRAQAVIRMLATTAGHFHKLGVVHRDLKPSNILLRKGDAGYKLVIADFGISRIVPADINSLPTPPNSDTATIRAYTALYASPQQKKFQPADRRDDVYALGVLWYQLLRGDLTLERPGGEGWKRGLAKLGVSEAIIGILNRCWDDDPGVRPGDGNELAKCLAGQPVIRIDQAEEAKKRKEVDRKRVEQVRREAERREAEEAKRKRAERVRQEAEQPVRERSERRTRYIVVASVLLCLLLVAGAGIWVGFFRNSPAEPETAGGQPTPTPPGVAGPPGVDDPRAANLKPGDTYILKYGNPQVEMRFRWIPPGTFKRGSDKYDNEKPVRDITISKGFWMGETECTQAQWRDIMDGYPDPSHFKGDNLPVEQVTARDAEEFCKELARITGKPMRLPSEAEWEYACRAGTTTEYCSGNGEAALKRVAWYASNSGDKTHPVGQLEPNHWGLRDMHGNVWEWCRDGYEADYYGRSPARDPVFIDNKTNIRIMRGGCSDSSPDSCRAAWRDRSTPPSRDIGFRVCFRFD